MKQDKKTTIVKIQETISIRDKNAATARLKEMFFANEDSKNRISIRRAEKSSKEGGIKGNDNSSSNEEGSTRLINSASFL